MEKGQKTLPKVLSILFIIAGFLFIALGTVGIVVPGLPTTPFYLLAAFCFMKGSTRLRNWFIGTKLYRKHIESFAATRSLSIKAKLKILIPVTITMVTFAVLVDIPIMSILIILLLLVKWWYFIYVIKTSKASAIK